MTKIMLVEDDKSLREIYGVRLLAEGYDIVTAGNGEEALAMAIKERPHLIIADVMMPKISGFDMLDILRSTSETRGIKVIIMTALGGDDQRNRGEQMGADRYLIKSQVGIEDVVVAVHEVLGDGPNAGASTNNSDSSNSSAPAPQSSAQPTQPSTPAPTSPANQQAQPTKPVDPNASDKPQLGSPTPHTGSGTPVPPSQREKVIEPIKGAEKTVDINELLNRELAKDAMNKQPIEPVGNTSASDPKLSDLKISAAPGAGAAPVNLPPQPAAEPVTNTEDRSQAPSEEEPKDESPKQPEGLPGANSPSSSGETAAPQTPSPSPQASLQSSADRTSIPIQTPEREQQTPQSPTQTTV